MSVDVEITIQKFLCDILPYLDENPDLEKNVGVYKILNSCKLPVETKFGLLCYEERNSSIMSTLIHSNKVYFPVPKTPRPIDLQLAEDNNYALIVHSGGVNEFVAYVIETERKQIYVFGHEELNPKLIDSGIIGSGDFNITPVVRRQQVGKISISQAYLNARLMLWARQVFQDYQVAFYHPIASDSNHNTMVGVKQKPREMNHKVVEDKDAMIRGIILSGIKREHLFDQVVKRIVQHLQYNRVEKNFIRTEYAKCAIKYFLANLQTGIDKVLVSSAKEWMQNKSTFPGKMMTFETVKGFRIIQDCKEKDMLTREDEKWLLSEMTTLCESHVEKHMSTLQSSCKLFIVQLEIHLKRRHASSLCRGEMNMHADILEKRGITSWLKELKDDNIDVGFTDISKLIKDLSDVGETATEQFSEQIKDCIKQYKQKLTIKKETVNGKNTLVVQGVYANTSEIVSLISSYTSIKKIDEIRIIVSKLIVVDSDIKGCPGRSLVVLADSIHVAAEDTEHFTIDTSGRDGSIIKPSKAEDGRHEGDAGEPGVDGSSGESGGNIYIRANEIQNASCLKINSNGGNGSNGQDGGRGQDGRNGEDGAALKESQFNREFPCITYGDIFTQIRNRNEILKRISISCDKGVLSRHVEGSVHVDGYSHDVIFCYYDTIINATSYLIVKGTAGTTGTSGGAGGKGGEAGRGGRAGTIVLDVKNTHGQSPDIEKVNGKDGEEGKDGQRGTDGRNGIKGVDNLRIEGKTQTKPHHYRGHLEILNNGKEKASDLNLWCIYHEAYGHKSPF